MDRARGPVGQPPKRLTATTPDELYAITGLIHDAHFDPDEVAFDEPAKTLTIPFAQEDPDRDGHDWEKLRETWWYEEHRVPFYAGRLTVSTATAVAFPKDFEDMWMLEEIEYDEKGSRVVIKAFDRIEMPVERLQVEAELTGTVALNIRRRSYRFMHAERDQMM